MRPVKAKELIVVIGPPGSGKTTLSRQQWPGYVLFDSDRIIEAVWGKLQFHAGIKRMAKGMVREGIRRGIEGGLAMVVPISGRTRQERSRIIDIARENGYRVTIARTMATPAECLLRCRGDAARPKTTDWEPIIDRWFRVYTPPEEGECDEYIEIVAAM